MSETRENMGSLEQQVPHADGGSGMIVFCLMLGQEKKRVHIDTQSEYHSSLLFPIIDSQVFRTSNGEF